MADRAADLQAELAGLLSQHEPTLRDYERTDLLQLEQRCALAAGEPPDAPRADGRRVPQPVRPRRAGGADRPDARGGHGRRASPHVPRATRPRSRVAASQLGLSSRAAAAARSRSACSITRRTASLFSASSANGACSIGGSSNLLSRGSAAISSCGSSAATSSPMRYSMSGSRRIVQRQLFDRSPLTCPGSDR